MRKVILGAAAVAVVALAVWLGRGGQQSAEPVTGAMTTQGVPDPLRVATEGAYPPFNETGANGTLKGFEVDLAQSLCKRLGVRCQIVAQSWDGLIPGLQAGKYDIILAAMSATQERRKAVAFTQPYAPTPVYFVAPKDSPLMGLDVGLTHIDLAHLDATSQAAIDKLKAALKGKSVGVQTATIHAGFLETYLGDAVTIRRYDTLQSMALDVAAGRVDAGLADMTGWQPFLDSAEGQNEQAFGPNFEGGVLGDGISIALRPEDTRLQDALNGALQAEKEDGSLKRLAELWFHYDASAH